MALSKYAKAPLPDATSPDDVPASFAAFMAVVDPKLVHYATDTAQRDANFGDAPVGTVVVVGSGTAVSGMTIYWKQVQATATWGKLYSDTGWITSGFVASTGFEIINCRGRNRNGWISIELFFSRTGVDLVPSATSPTGGNIGDTKMFDAIPASLRPGAGSPDIVSWLQTAAGGGGARLTPGGIIYVTTLMFNNTWQQDQNALITFSYPEG